MSTDVGRCAGCGAAILWVEMLATGRKNPLNLEPDSERGNVQLLGPGTARALSLEEALTLRSDGVKLWLSHFATCPKRLQFRR